MDNQILKYCLEKYPEEACGVILNKKGTLTWIPCENIAEDKENSFKISAIDFASLSLQGDIYAIVHSHPDATCEPSEKDKKASEHLKVPYHIYSIPSGEKHIYTPTNSIKPYIGRVYEFGVTDCWTLVRDYYLKEFNYKLPMIEFDEDFYEKGLDYFGKSIEPWGGEEVSTPQKGDIVYFNIMNDIENHCGVYIGEGKYIHHMRDRLSCTDSIYSRWGKYITRYIRCKKLFS